MYITSHTSTYMYNINIYIYIYHKQLLELEANIASCSLHHLVDDVWTFWRYPKFYGFIFVSQLTLAFFWICPVFPCNVVRSYACKWVVQLAPQLVHWRVFFHRNVLLVKLNSRLLHVLLFFPVSNKNMSAPDQSNWFHDSALLLHLYPMLSNYLTLDPIKKMLNNHRCSKW